jgi:hypothetical protein
MTDAITRPLSDAIVVPLESQTKPQPCDPHRRALGSTCTSIVTATIGCTAVGRTAVARTRQCGSRTAMILRIAVCCDGQPVRRTCAAAKSACATGAEEAAPRSRQPRSTSSAPPWNLVMTLRYSRSSATRRLKVRDESPSLRHTASSVCPDSSASTMGTRYPGMSGGSISWTCRAEQLNPVAADSLSTAAPCPFSFVT